MKQKTSANHQPEAPFSFTQLPRSAGILLHITSLPSYFGIGDLGPGAYTFADFLHRGGQTFWQLLPLNPTSAGQGFSPYSANSGMAGNPLLISPELLIKDGLLSKKDIAKYKVEESDKVDYEAVEKTKHALLDKAYTNYVNNPSNLEKEFKAFGKKESYWLNDFALYTVLKNEHAGKQWSDWEEPYKQHDAKALKKFEAAQKTAIDKIKWQQFIFLKQWQQLKRYCNNLNIQMFGDMPIYVAYDSADVWANRDIFSIDKTGKQQFVAGTPPDDFNENGQLWGMPIFKWAVLKEQNYNWWLNRLRKNLQLFDLLRLDHFRAFAAYWQIKAGAKTAKEGKWINAPGHEFFSIIKKELGKMPFVAEDLGHIDEPVYKLRDDFELPGMEVLQFAFGEEMPQSVHIPHHHLPVSVVYTGTHDTNTTVGWYKQLDKQVKQNLSNYLGVKVTQKNVCDLLCRTTYASVAKLAVLPMQDVLYLDEKARINIPSSGENNWAWRITSAQINEAVEERLKAWCTLYDRLPK